MAYEWTPDNLSRVLNAIPTQPILPPQQAKDTVAASVAPQLYGRKPAMVLAQPSKGAVDIRGNDAYAPTDAGTPPDYMNVPPAESANQWGSATFEDQYRASQTPNPVPFRRATLPMPVYNTPERDAANKTLNTPAPVFQRAPWWKILAGALSTGAMAYGGNPHAAEIGERAINSGYYRGLDTWSRNQAQSRDILGEQDKSYAAQSSNWDRAMRNEDRDEFNRIRQQNADTLARKESDLASARSELNETRREKSPSAVRAERTQAADEQGLKGSARQYYILTGKMPDDNAAERLNIARERLDLDREKANNKGGNPDKPASKWQFGRIEREKNQSLRKAEADHRNGLLSDDELEQEKQSIQDEYEQQISNLGGDPQHFDYSTQPQKGGKPKANPQPAPQTNAAPAAKRKVVGPDGKTVEVEVRNGKWVISATGKPL